MAKVFTLHWVYEAFDDDPTFMTKRMFGGLAIYVHGKMVMVLVEDPGNREWKGETFDYDIWSGILFPTDREFHADILKDFPSLVSHPILGKWLYLPMSDESFEGLVDQIAERIAKKDSLFGIIPQARSKRKKKKKVVKKTKNKKKKKR